MLAKARVFSLFLFITLVAAACGQKAGVAGKGGGLAIGGEEVPGAEAGGAEGLGETPLAELGAGGGGVAAGAGGGGEVGGPAAGPTRTAGPTAAQAAGDRTGVYSNLIVVGVHAPVTGAAPFPQTTFERAKNLYWDWLKNKGVKIHGRDVVIKFRDDEYKPDVARQRCLELIEKEKVFILIGGGGTEQITACAQVAREKGVPYFSAGVNEDPLLSLSNYFALSITYPQQAPLLAQYARNVLRLPAGTKAAIVVGNSRGFDDSYAALKRAVAAAGFQVVFDRRVSPMVNPTPADVAPVMNDLAASGAQVVFTIVSPVYAIYMAQTKPATYNAYFLGPGITAGENAVAEFGCQGSKPMHGWWRFFSPFPGLDKADQVDPEYRQAYRTLYPNDTPDDIGLAFWGLSKTLHRVFEAAGRDLSRERLVQTLESGQTFSSGVFPPVRYSRTEHRGANQVHALRVDCNVGQWVTDYMFRSSF